MHPRRIGHVFRHDFRDRQRREIGVQRQRPANLLRDRLSGQLGIKGDFTLREGGGIDNAEPHIGIGNGDLRAAQLVTYRAGLRAGAVGADLHPAQGIDAGDRSAARADLHHFDHRDPHRQAGSLLVAVYPTKFETAGNLRLVVVDKTNFGGGAAHIERQHLRRL